MNAVKERIFGAVSIMNDTEAKNVWDYILSEFSPRTWDDIEEVEPDEWDLQMLEEIKNDPECHEFIPAAAVMKELGL